MIAASVMYLTALPAFTDNTICRIDDGANAILVGPGSRSPWPRHSMAVGSAWRRF
jgi:hypothetical protein